MTEIFEWKLADVNGSVGSIADLKSKGPGFESQIRQGFFPHTKNVKDIVQTHYVKRANLSSNPERRRGPNQNRLSRYNLLFM
jgi:hypothetical protein